MMASLLAHGHIRCVLFFGATPHAVDTVAKGVRKSLVMSLWNEVPLGYRSGGDE
jgi:hypothetical protein